MAKYDFKTYVLTNEERAYFGLNPIEKNWDEVDIKKDLTVYFDGDTIKKTIEYQLDRDDIRREYKEFDTELFTKERKILLPKTSRGKEKKLNYTSITSTKPTGVCFIVSLKSASWKPSIYAWNPRNRKSLPKVNDFDNISSIGEFKKWLECYIKTCPKDYFEKIEVMKTAKHKTVKYYNGDIFRFEIDREHYGFGIIIAQIAKMMKDSIFAENHAMNNTMAMPILIRLYGFKTKDKNMPIEEIIKHRLIESDIITDNSIIWGKYEIVGSKHLEENDIDFPPQAGVTLNYNKPLYRRFCFGVGMKEVKKLDVKIEEFEENNFLNHGVTISINTDYFLKKLEPSDLHGKEDILSKMQLNFPLQKTNTIKKVLKAFGIPKDITFDEFNKQYNGMTRKEYIEYQRKYERKISKIK